MKHHVLGGLINAEFVVAHLYIRVHTYIQMGNVVGTQRKRLKYPDGATPLTLIGTNKNKV
jgi:hypothetical protein